MKKLRIAIIVTLSAIALHAAPKEHTINYPQLWDSANTAYLNNNYDEALVLYDSISRSGVESTKLYYNMGNSYFKSGKIGLSILYYNKALRLDPDNDDVRHNLAVANTYTKNRIEPLPEFFLTRWIGSLYASLSANGWTILSIALFVATLGCSLLYLLPLTVRLRKTGFYAALIGLLLFVAASAFAARGYRDGKYLNKAIVMSSAISVKSSPDNSGKDLFILYEGTKVEIRDEVNGWNEIVIADGNRGWIKSSAIALID